MVRDGLRSAFTERPRAGRKGHVGDLAVPLVEPEHVRISVHLPQGSVRLLVGVWEAPDLNRLGRETDRREVKDQSTVGSRTGHEVSTGKRTWSLRAVTFDPSEGGGDVDEEGKC